MSVTDGIVAYITPHGLGHAGRTADILEAFRKKHGEIPLTVVSSLPQWFRDSRLPSASYRTGRFDVGMVQKDAVLMDIPTTLQQLKKLVSEWDSKVSEEANWLKKSKAGLVLSDIPALPLEAAHRAGIPAVGLSNFSWDWLYSKLAHLDSDWQIVADKFATGYSKAEGCLRYPFHAPMEAFPKLKDVPIVASAGRPNREAVARITGADPSKTWLLFCLAQLHFTPNGVSKLGSFTDYQFFTTGELNWQTPNCHSLNPGLWEFSDLVASCDAVVTKPGFGILSDCVANKKPILYVERDNFPEYPVMVEGIRRHLSGYHIPLRGLREGALERALQALKEGLPRPNDPLSAGGASVVADLLGRLYHEEGGVF